MGGIAEEWTLSFWAAFGEVSGSESDTALLLVLYKEPRLERHSLSLLP